LKFSDQFEKLHDQMPNKQIETQINQLVYQLYGLMDEEIAIVEGIL